MLLTKGEPRGGFPFYMQCGGAGGKFPPLCQSGTAFPALAKDFAPFFHG